MRALILGLALCLAPLAAFAQATGAPLSRLHDDLHLSPSQEAAWSAYTRAVGTNPEMEARRRATDEMLPTLPTPRRIALIAATLDAEAADFRKLGAAVTAFYAQLTPAQQKTFDAETLPPRPGGAR